jgi:hypothetical protein
MDISSIKYKNLSRGSEPIHVDRKTDGQMDEWTDMTKVIVNAKCEDTKRT